MMSQQLWVASKRESNNFMPSRKFHGRLENLQDIGDFVVECARTAGFNDADIYAIQLAVDEAATNIIEHAYKDEVSGDIDLKCEPSSDGIKIVLRDYGRPFDPNTLPEPALNVPLEELKPRGLGVFLIRQMMDEVEYKFNDKKGNSLTMIKYKKVE
jgi:serine/threonine-protein kinase RsbW